ncbi:MAG TPA: hypothetical protein VGL86_18835 [Polyangia bacterium]|jgi:hypothetical protein
MGKLERARIHVLKGDGTSSTDFDSIEVCFNPKEYSLDKSVSWDAEKAFSDAPQPEFKAPTPMELSVTLQFDTYEERTNVRDKWVRKIEKLALMTGDLPSDGSKASKSDKQKFRPPTILFIWGRFTFKGVVESLSQKYTMFLSDGTPVRAECALKIRNVLDKNVDDDKSQSWSGDTQTRSVDIGPDDRLDLIAAKELGDAGRWAEIAALNNVVDAGNIADANGKRLTKLDIPAS